MRLDELALAQLGHLEHEVQRPADFLDDGLVAEDDGPRRGCGRLMDDAADDHRVEEGPISDSAQITKKVGQDPRKYAPFVDDRVPSAKGRKKEGMEEVE